MTVVRGKFLQRPFTLKMCTEANMRHMLGFYRKEQGATLIVALVFLLILTVAGITAVRLSTSSERMASNSQFRGMSFQLAQSELKAQQLSMNGGIASRAPLQLSMSRPAQPISRFPERRQALALTPQISATGLTQASTVNSLGIVDCMIFGEGTSAGSFICNQFELNARSTLAGGAYSEQVGGLVMSTPK